MVEKGRRPRRSGRACRRARDREDRPRSQRREKRRHRQHRSPGRRGRQDRRAPGDHRRQRRGSHGRGAGADTSTAAGRQWIRRSGSCCRESGHPHCAPHRQGPRRGPRHSSGLGRSRPRNEAGRAEGDGTAAPTSNKVAPTGSTTAPTSPSSTAPTTRVKRPHRQDASVAPTSRSEERVRMSKRRQTIARRLVEAQHTAAMLTTFNEVDMSAVMELRERRKESFKKEFGVGLGIASFFVKIGGRRPARVSAAQRRDSRRRDRLQALLRHRRRRRCGRRPRRAGHP